MRNDELKIVYINKRRIGEMFKQVEISYSNKFATNINCLDINMTRTHNFIVVRKNIKKFTGLG